MSFGAIFLPDNKSLGVKHPYTVSPSGAEFLITTLDDQYECTGIGRYVWGADKAEPFINFPDADVCDPAYSWDGSKLVYTSNVKNTFTSTSLVIANVDGSSRQIVPTPTLKGFQIRYPSWSPNGKQLAFAYGRFPEGYPADSEIYVINLPPELQATPFYQPTKTP